MCSSVNHFNSDTCSSMSESSMIYVIVCRLNVIPSRSAHPCQHANTSYRVSLRTFWLTPGRMGRDRLCAEVQGHYTCAYLFKELMCFVHRGSVTSRGSIVNAGCGPSPKEDVFKVQVWIFIISLRASGLPEAEKQEFVTQHGVVMHADFAFLVIPPSAVLQINRLLWYVLFALYTLHWGVKPGFGPCEWIATLASVKGVKVASSLELALLMPQPFAGSCCAGDQGTPWKLLSLYYKEVCE